MNDLPTHKTFHVDRLKVEVYPNRTSLGTTAGKSAAEQLRQLLKQQERVRMIFAAAPSQNEFLQTLVSEEGVDWNRVTAFHMDEYIGLPLEAPQCFGQFLKKRIFDYVRPGELHYIDSSKDIREECKRYGNLISQAPIDMVCLGIGENGHIAFNDPPVADFEDKLQIKTVELDDACRIQQVHDGCFANLDDVPKYALTLTIPVLLSGKFLYCMVPGETKREAVNKVLRGPISTACPASILRTHPQCILYLDKDSYTDE